MRTGKQEWRSDREQGNGQRQKGRGKMRLPKFSQPIRNLQCMIGCCLLWVCACVILDFPRVFFSARHKAHDVTCMQNMRGLSTALLQYSQDWDETFPPSAHWADTAASRIKPADIPQTFHCPDAPSPYSYVFNVNLDKIRLKYIHEPAATPMLYEGEVIENNAAGDGISMPGVKRHAGGAYIGYADGHVKWNNPSSVKELNWKNRSVPQNDIPRP
jgi:prepilin-type processing-associated H-X9-DG protein